MKQSALDRCVAQATGETITRVRHMGFSLMRMPQRYVATQEIREEAPRQHGREAAAREPHAERCC